MSQYIHYVLKRGIFVMILTLISGVFIFESINLWYMFLIWGLIEFVYFKITISYSSSRTIEKVQNALLKNEEQAELFRKLVDDIINKYEAKRSTYDDTVKHFDGIIKELKEIKEEKLKTWENKE